MTNNKTERFVHEALAEHRDWAELAAKQPRPITERDRRATRSGDTSYPYLDNEQYDLRYD